MKKKKTKSSNFDVLPPILSINIPPLAHHHHSRLQRRPLMEGSDSSVFVVVVLGLSSRSGRWPKTPAGLASIKSLQQRLLHARARLPRSSGWHRPPRLKIINAPKPAAPIIPSVFSASPLPSYPVPPANHTRTKPRPGEDVHMETARRRADHRLEQFNGAKMFAWIVGLPFSSASLFR